FKAELAVMVAIGRSPVFWRYGPAVAMLAVMNFAYLGLWAGPWLRDVAGYEGQARANTLLLYTLGAMTGVLLIGAVTSRTQARGYRGVAVLLWCHAGLLAAQIALALQPGGAAVPWVWVLFAFFAAGSTPGYVIVGQMFPREQMGRVSTPFGRDSLPARAPSARRCGSVLRSRALPPRRARWAGPTLARAVRRGRRAGAGLARTAPPAPDPRRRQTRPASPLR